VETEISELIPIYTLTKLMLASVKVGEVGPYVHILAVVISSIFNDDSICVYYSHKTRIASATTD